MKVPEEWLECHFILEDGETFKVDYEYVDVDTTDAEGQFRDDEVKRWTLSTKNYSRELTEETVASVMVVVKDEYQDEAHALPRPEEPGMREDE